MRRYHIIIRWTGTQGVPFTLLPSDMQYIAEVDLQGMLLLAYKLCKDRQYMNPTITVQEVQRDL